MSKLAMFPCFVLVVAAAVLAIPTPAQAQYGQQQTAVQQRVTEAQTWGQDGWLYVMQRGRWVRTTYSRRFPDPRNYPSVFDIFENGRFVRRVGVSAPVTSQAPAANRQLSGTETQLYQLIDELNRQQAIAAAQAAAGTGRPVPGAEGTIGGFSLNTPNINPLTVDSVRGDAIRAQPTPMGQTLSLVNGIVYPQPINRGTAITLYGYPYVWRR